MGFLARLFGAPPRIGPKGITAEQLGRALFDRAISRLPDYHAELTALGAFAENPNLARSKEYMASSIIFVFAPLEQVLTDVPIPEVRSAKVTIRALLVDKLQARSAAELNSLVDAQFGRFIRAVRSRNLSALGQLAAQTSGLPTTPDIEHFLASYYTSGLNFWFDALAEFGIDTS